MILLETAKKAASLSAIEGLAAIEKHLGVARPEELVEEFESAREEVEGGAVEDGFGFE